MKPKVLIQGTRIAVLLASIPLLATLAIAGPRGEGPGGPGFHHGDRPGERFEKHLKELDLAPEQMKRVQAILDSAKETRREKRTQMLEAFGEMRGLLEQDPPDEAAVLRQAERIGELRTEGHKSMLRTLLAIRAELTPEQREQLKEMRGRMGPRPWGGGSRREAPDEE